MKKYAFTDKTIEFRGRTLHRIIALRDFGDVKTGDMGGFVEKEDNLFQEGNCWVYEDAKVYGDATVCGNAKVFGGAKVYGNARVFGDAVVCGDAEVCGKAEVCGTVCIEKTTETNRERFEREKVSFSKAMELFNESGMSDFNELLNVRC